MKAAIAGCGGIARSHVAAIHASREATICGVCDLDIFAAKELSGRLGGVPFYGGLAQLIEEQRPDVVHVLTPPLTHAKLCVAAMESGCHVLVEKPMTLSAEDADTMLDCARRNNRLLCVNHNYLFNPCVVTALQELDAGTIGSVVHVQSYYGVAAEATYLGKSAAGHWALRLPGGVFTNFMPHSLYLHLRFMGNIQSVDGVSAVGDLAAGSVPRELAVVLHSRSATGTMTFSTRAKPYAKFVEIYGNKGTIHVDLTRELCLVHRERSVPQMIGKVLYSAESSLQIALGTLGSTARVLTGAMKRTPGLHRLVTDFYQALAGQKECPVTGEQGRDVVRLMEAVWARMPHAPTTGSAAPMSADPHDALPRRTVWATGKISKRVLVTGATGFLGRHLVNALLQTNARVVVLVRDESRVPPDLDGRVDIVHGDIRDSKAIACAMRNVDVVFHCAAVTKNNVPWSNHYDINVVGTRNVLEAALGENVGRVVHVSSVAVYGMSRRLNRRVVDETTPYAARLSRWSFYARSKIEAEKIAFEFQQARGLPLSVARLGILFGPGSKSSPGSGILRLGRLELVIGRGRNRLPYTFVGNAVDALLRAAMEPRAVGNSYNVVDDPQVPVRELRRCVQETRDHGVRTITLCVPGVVMLAVGLILETTRALRGIAIPPRLSRFVVRSACRDACYSTSRAQTQLGWKPAVGLREALGQL